MTALSPTLAALAFGFWLLERALGPAAPMAFGTGGIVPADGGEEPRLAAPPDTREFYPLRDGPRFQAVYESGLAAAAVRGHYEAALRAQGFAAAVAPLPDDTDMNGAGSVEFFTYRRGDWRVDLQFFPPETADGCEYRLSVLGPGRPRGRGGHRPEPEGEP